MSSNTLICNKLKRINLLSLLQLALMVASVIALFSRYSAGEEYPKPSTGTEADFYVSWDTGNDNNPGTFEKPFKTPGKAVDVLKSLSDPAGKVVLVRGGYYGMAADDGNRLNLTYLNGAPGAPIEIRGYPGETVMLDAFLEPFDPLAIPFSMKTSWGGVCFNKCSHILVENFQIMGCAMWNVGVTDSDHITLRFIEASRAAKHGLFTGGSFHHLTLEACKFYEQMYGPQASHGVYISGGHWDPALPPVRDITIRYVESYFNGRHGIQFNGRIENITVEHCNLHHNVLGGLSLIGVRNALVQRNLMYKNNKQGVIMYTYFDHSYWDPEDPESLKHWKETHWTIENVDIENNTFFMDEIAWYDDEWINYNPTYHAAIYMYEESGYLPPFDNINIHRNIVYNHSKMLVNIRNEDAFKSVTGFNNLCLSTGHTEAVSCDCSYPVKELEVTHPDLWGGNIVKEDPLFLVLKPTVLIDGTCKPIDFSDPKYTNFDDDFHLEVKSPAWKVAAGAFLDFLPTAKTLIEASTTQKIPDGYGKDIVRKVFTHQMKPEIQNWFLSLFHPRLHCLKSKHRFDGKDRICFKHPKNKLISFAIYNGDPKPLMVLTQLFSKKKDLEFGNAFAVVFDADLDIKVMPSMELEEDAIEYLLGEKSLAIFVVPYEEK